jgi:biotin operon repressor
MSEIDAALLEVAEEQLRWTRAAAIPAVRQTILEALPRSDQRRAFELCDGSRSGPQIAKAVGVSRQSIFNWSTAWRQLGIAYEVEDRKIRHLVSLTALGITTEVSTDEVDG